jgi:hypothetical protein
VTDTVEPSATPVETPTPAPTLPPTETPAPTSAFVPEPGAGISRGGIDLLTATACYDFDAGAASPCTDGAHDVWWQQVSDIERYLVPENGTLIAVWGTVPPSRGDCAQARLTSARIGGAQGTTNELVDGVYLCFMTDDSKIGGLHIVRYGADLLFEFLVWADTG